MALFFGKRFALLIKMVYPLAIIAPVAASDIPGRYAAAVVGIVAIMAGTFGAGESLTSDINDGILVRLSLTPLSPYRLVFEVLAVNAVLDFVQLLPALLVVYLLHPAPLVWMLAATFGGVRDARGGELHRGLYRELHLFTRRRACSTRRRYCSP